MTNHNRFNLIQTRHIRQITRAAQDFGDHEGMGTPKITRWLAQFDDPDIGLALKVLDESKYYSSENIRALVHNLVGITNHHFRQFPQDRILYVPIGFPYEGSAIIARALRDELEGEERIIQMADLENLEKGTFDALVFLDDFSGTGRTLKTWWKNVEMIILPRNVPFVIALLVLNQRARNVVEQFAGLLCVDELNEDYNVFSQNSAFTNNEKTKLVKYCRKTGCSSQYLMGFKGCGLLVAFKHQCPNNSLPILWHTNENPQWESLFKRYAI